MATVPDPDPAAIQELIEAAKALRDEIPMREKVDATPWVHSIRVPRVRVVKRLRRALTALEQKGSR